MDNDFHYAMYLTSSLYGVEMQPDEWEEIALIAWNLIGNKKYRLYKYTTTVDKETLSIELPCNADIIEAVTYGFEDWNYTTNTTPNGDYNSAFVESYIEGRKLFNNPLYASGRFVKYTRIGDTLYFDKAWGKINILYKGVLMGDDDLPEINDKEARAIATYVAYTYKFKEGIVTSNANIIQMSTLLEQKWTRYCDAARVPVNLNQNDMDKILDAKTSWNRKIHNKSYKPV